MIKKEDFFFIGKIIKKRGLEGEVEIDIDENFSALYEADLFMIDIDNIFIPFFVENIREKNNSVIIVKFEDVNDNKAEKLVNKSVYLSNNFLNSSEEDSNLPINSLLYFTLIGKEQGKIGKIIEIDNSTINTLFTVISEDEKKEYLIPFSLDIILDINFETKTILLNLPHDILSI